MTISSGARSLILDALGWVAVAALGAVVLTNLEDAKRIVATGLGLPAPDQIATIQAEAPDRAPQARPGSGVELTAGHNGHYFTEVEVNGRPIEVLVDTGASMVALTFEDAERAGLFLRDRDFTHAVSTANGMARVAPVTLDRVSIGPITVRNVRAAVSERGRLQTTLLGMSFLGRLSRVDIQSGRLILHE